jgi:hypothetical protein
MYEVEISGNLTTMQIDVYGYFTRYEPSTYWQPEEGGYFEISNIKKNGIDITKRLDKCKGLIEQIEQYIEENYSE